MYVKDTYIIGAKFKNNQGHGFEIIELNCDNNRRKVKIRFLDEYKAEVVVYDSTIRRGTCSNPYHTSINGIGIVGVQEVNFSKTKSYRCWIAMINRVYGVGYYKTQQTYKDVKICDEWFLYDNFKAWFNCNFPLTLNHLYLELDKDLLSGENRIYSPKTCIFLPKSINNFLQMNAIKNKTFGTLILPSGKYRVQCVDFETNKNISLGSYVNLCDAHKVYLDFKNKQCESARQYLRSLNYLPEEIIQLIKTV